MATWHVNWVDGSDTTGDGLTAATAWKTFNKAEGEATSGDTISAATGSYAENYTCAKTLTHVIVSGATVTIVPASGAFVVDIEGNSIEPTFTGIDFDGSSLDSATSITIKSDNNNIATFSDAVITGSGGNATRDDTIDTGSSGTFTFNSCTIDTLATGDTSVRVGGSTSDTLTLDACTITNASGNDVVFDDNAAAGFTIVVRNGCTIKQTNTGDVAGNCIDTTRGKVICTENVLINDSVSTDATEGLGIKAGMTEATQQHTILNNTIVGATCIEIIGATTHGSAKANIKNNGLVCTSAHTNKGCIRFQIADHETATFLDYNGYYQKGAGSAYYGRIAGADSDTLADWKTATSQETNAVDGDPSFTDFDADDLSLGSSSIWINEGLDVGLGFVGSAPDIGGVQLTSSSNATTGIYDFKLSDGTQFPITVAAGTVFIFDRTPEIWESGFTPIGSGFTANANSFWDFQTDSNTLWLMGASETLHKWTGDTNTTGSVTVTNGDATVTGSGTDFESPALGEDGKFILSDTGEVLTISSVTNGTALELDTAYEGATRATVSFTAYTYQPAAGSPPTGKYIRVFNNYLFMAGNSTNTSRLYYSNLKDFETWGGGDFIDINRQDGDPITALFLLGDYLYIGKEDSLWRLEFTGDALFPWILNKMADVGVRSHWSVQGTSSIKLFLSEDGVYMMPVGGQPQKVSTPIESSDQLLGTDTSRWQYSQALYQPEHREYWLHLTSDGGTQNDTFYIYDIAKQAWSTWIGISMNSLGQVESTANRWTPFGGDASGNVYELDSGTSDNSAAIDMIVQSKGYDFGSAAMEKQLRQAILTFSKDSVWSCTVSHRTDFNAWIDQTVLSTDDESSGTGLFKRRIQLTNDTVGHYFELKIRNNQADKALTIYGWSLMPKGLGNR